MKRGILITTILLSFVLVMSLGVVSAWAGGKAISFVKPLDEDVFPASKSIEVEVEVNQPDYLDTINITIWNDAGYSETILDNNPTISGDVATVTHTFSNLIETDHYLIAKANDSSDTWISTAQIKVEYNDAPVIVFSMNTSIGVVPFAVLFDASSTGDPEENTPLTYEWDFGDGNSDTGEVVEHTYTTAGVYTVELTVTDSLGMSDSLTKTVRARPSCGTLGADETCVAVPEDLSCDIEYKPFEAGLNCDEASAKRYCEDTLNYVGYIAGSKNCETTNNHEITNYGQSNFCGGAKTDYKWILSLKCTGTASAAGTCTDTDDGNDPFDYGEVSIGGTFVDNDTCLDGTLNETYCNNSQIAYEEHDCSIGCTAGACVEPPEGLFCLAKNTLRQASPGARQTNSTGLYYCDLDLAWRPAKPTIDDISCIAAGTCPSASKCLAKYECISNSCVDEYCISITGELQAQRGILVKIWCFLTNMGDFFDLKEDYCVCVMNNDIDAYWDAVAKECTV